MPKSVSARDVKSWLSDGDEIALLDVREYGDYGSSHPFFVIPAAYSVFEERVASIVPRTSTRMVLVDGGDGVAGKAALCAEALGYTDVYVMDGGAPAWSEAGYTLYEGVNVPSKTFGELLELARHTPRLPAEKVVEMQRSGADHIIIDGRPFAEYSNFSIPGGICCPNGELALRIRDLVPSKDTTIIVNCAGRTRSILGAQTLIDAGIENKVYALENGTQGWFLAGLEVDRGATRRYSEQVSDSSLDERRQTARKVAERSGVKFSSADAVQSMLDNAARTTFLFDVRTAEEFAADSADGFVPAPGGQLVQSTDQWVGVKGAHLVLLDVDGIRAPMVANWLAQLGHEAIILEGGLAAARKLSVAKPVSMSEAIATVPGCAASDVDLDAVQLVDLRPSTRFREACIVGSRWSIRPRLGQIGLGKAKPVVLAGDATVVALAAADLTKAGHTVKHLSGDVDDWRAAGLPIATSPDEPSDADCIDHLFFTAGRHDGDEAASRRYLEWEIGLVDQLDEQERSTFHIVQP